MLVDTCFLQGLEMTKRFRQEKYREAHSRRITYTSQAQYLKCTFIIKFALNCGSMINTKPFHLQVKENNLVRQPNSSAKSHSPNTLDLPLSKASVSLK